MVFHVLNVKVKFCAIKFTQNITFFVFSLFAEWCLIQFFKSIKELKLLKEHASHPYDCSNCVTIFIPVLNIAL